MPESPQKAEPGRAKKPGRRPVVPDRIKLFVQKLSVDSDDYADLWSDEWSTFSDKAPTTRAIYTSRYRKAIQEAHGSDHPALRVVKVLEATTTDELRELDNARDSPRGPGGRKATRIEKIDKFAQTVAALNEARQEAVKQGRTAKQADKAYEKALTKLWAGELEQAQSTLKLTTILSLVVQFRNELRRLGIDDDLTLSVVRAPDEMTRARNKAYLSSIVNQHDELVAVNSWLDLVDAAKGRLPDYDASWTNLEDVAREAAKQVSREQAVMIGAALGLLTGRRPVEIFVQGVFMPLPLPADPLHQGVSRRAFERYRVLFSGQAKTRGNAGTAFDASFAIPVLTDARDIIYAWMVLRWSESGQLWRQMTSEQFKADVLMQPNSQFTLEQARAAVFGKLWPKPKNGDSEIAIESKKLKAHNIRALYAEIADQFFRPDSKSKTRFFAEALGHTEKDMETAMSYMRYYLPDQKDAGATKRVKGRLSTKITVAAEEREAEQAGDRAE